MPHAVHNSYLIRLMLRRTLALAVAFVIADPFTAPASHPVTLGAAPAQASAREQLYGALAGSWRGTLEYKDYKDPSQRTTLPTLLEAPRADAGSVTLALSYDDGPGKTVKESDRLTLDAAGKTLMWTSGSSTQSYAVRTFEAPRPGHALRLVLEGEGSDNDPPATIRETLVVGLNKLQILRETRAPGKSEFAFRHRYELTRAQ
jgi:hypothetical protein